MSYHGNQVGSGDEDPWRRASAHALRSSEHFVNGVFEANRALFSALNVSSRPDAGEAGEAEPVDAEQSWTFERTAETREELGVGDAVRFTKQISEADVASFARTTGDTNPLHLDEEYAEQTRFGGRIVHGVLVSGLVSAALARLPGVAIYLSQSVEFRGPAEIGDTFTADCEIVEELGDDRYRVETEVRSENSEETIVDGESVVLVDEAPDAAD